MKHEILIDRVHMFILSERVNIHPPNRNELLPNHGSTGTTSSRPTTIDHSRPMRDSDTSSLKPDWIWAYPCKHPPCLYHGKTWTQQNDFLKHFKTSKYTGKWRC